jgi:hypothetical protein
MNVLTIDRQPARRPAIGAAAVFLAVAVFQAALALGAPLGHAAWGGAHDQLTVSLRLGSGVAVAICLLAALIILGRAGYRPSPLPPAVTRWGARILVVVLPLSALLNFASPSMWERFLWGPLALLLAALCIAVVRGR